MLTTRSSIRYVLRTLLVATATLTGFFSLAQAQNYPNKPVRVIVPWPAGGLVDVAARQLTNRMQTMLGQPFVVENKLGAGGNIGADQVAKASATACFLPLAP
jgi:tripartite-type tricarboxylate transporter receptor subunit TctC